MFENYPFTQEEGGRADEDLKLLALSTCGFCRKSKAFLREEGWTFSWIDVDLLPPEEKQELVREFQEQFKARPMYPCLIINEADLLMSFIRPQWETRLKA